MGFEKEILENGTGPDVGRGQKVTVHCTGYGKDRDLSQKVSMQFLNYFPLTFLFSILVLEHQRSWTRTIFIYNWYGTSY